MRHSGLILEEEEEEKGEEAEQKPGENRPVPLPQSSAKNERECKICGAQKRWIQLHFTTTSPNAFMIWLWAWPVVLPCTTAISWERRSMAVLSIRFSP